jgi:hypothetical protein
MDRDELGTMADIEPSGPTRAADIEGEWPSPTTRPSCSPFSDLRPKGSSASWTSVVSPVRRSASDRFEERFVDFNFFDKPDAHSELQVFQQIAQSSPSTRSIAGAPSRVASLRTSAVKLAVVMMRPLSARPTMAPRKSRTTADPTDAFHLLA